jgi:hypothetical protein
MYGDAAGTKDYLSHAHSLGMKVIFAMDDPVFWDGADLRGTLRRMAATCKCSNNTSFITYVIDLVKSSPALWRTTSLTR